MKTKAVVATMVTMLLVFSAFYIIPIRAQNILRIGVIGPVGWPQFDSMQEGAILARDWINGPGGGIVIDGIRYDVSLHFGDEHAADMRPDLGALEMRRLITEEEVDFVIGGYNVECVTAMREVAMDYNKLFFICGAAANELVDCGTGTCGACVKCDYARYKYLFRITPINNTMLFYNILGFLSGYALPYRLVPLYGSPVKTAVITEDLDWTVMLWNLFTGFGAGGTGTYLGPHADVVMAASARTPLGTSDFSTYLDAMHANEIRLVVQIYSAPDSIVFITQMAGHPLKAVVAGIDVLAQSSDFWTWTGGACEYETLLASSGTRSPISTTSQPYTTVEFWDNYFAAFGHAPIYTAFGAYDAIIAMHDMLEGQTGPTYITPPFDTADANALVPLIEATDRESILGRFAYTQYHDPMSTEYGSYWNQRYVRPLVVQWQAGRLEVVWPMDQPYSKLWSLPDETDSMYPYPQDVNQDGYVDFADAMIVDNAFGSYPTPPDEPSHPKWWFVADVVRDNYIDVLDALAVQAHYEETVPLPLLYCNEGGWPPLPPPPERLMTKALSATEGELGDVVHVTLTVKLPADETVAVVDTLPEGFSYINGTFMVDGVPSTPVIDGPNISYTITTPGLHDLEFDVKIDKAKAWEDWEVCNVAVATWYDAEGNVVGTKEDTKCFVIHPFEALHKKAYVEFNTADLYNITDTMDAGWVMGSRTGLDGFVDYGYSTDMYTSAPASIFAHIWGWGTRGQDWAALWINKTFSWEPDMALTRLKLNYLIDEMTDGDGWGGMASHARVEVITHDATGKHVYTYIVAGATTNVHDWSYDYCKDYGPNTKYINWYNEEIPAPGHGELEPPTDVWYTLDRNVYADFDIDWSTVTEIEIMLELEGGYLHMDHFKVYFDDLELEGLPIKPIKEKTEIQWILEIEVTNTFPYTMTDTVIKDSFGAELEIDWYNATQWYVSITHGTASYVTKGKSAKVFLTWEIGDLLPGETARLTLLVSTDINPAGIQEYSEPGIYKLNSGATLKFIDPEQDTQLSAVTDSIYVTVLPEEDP